MIIKHQISQVFKRKETGKKGWGDGARGGRERQRELMKRRKSSSVRGKWDVAWVDTTVGVEINTWVFLERDINRTNKLSIEIWRFGWLFNYLGSGSFSRITYMGTPTKRHYFVTLRVT
jgi:hypothetical protein